MSVSSIREFIPNNTKLEKWIHNTKISHRNRGLVSGSVSKDYLKKLCIKEIKKPCKYCGIKMYMNNPDEDLRPSFDIIDPVHGFKMGNIQVICRNCNSSKGTMSHKEYLNHLKQVQLNKLGVD